MPDVTISSGGPPETVLPDAPPGLDEALAGTHDPEVVASMVAAHPSEPATWARAGELAERAAGTVEQQVRAYALYRVGYHRGLDLLRRHGWKGSGYVRWEHSSNRGFLRCLDGLGRMAAAIGEEDEAARCEEFLAMLDPAWPPG